MRIALVQLALIQTRRRRSAGQRQPPDVTSVGALLRTPGTRSAPSVRGRSQTGCPTSARINVRGPSVLSCDRKGPEALITTQEAAGPPREPGPKPLRPGG